MKSDDTPDMIPIGDFAIAIMANIAARRSEYLCRESSEVSPAFTDENTRLKPVSEISNEPIQEQLNYWL
jgi:hypothetical protein